MSIPVELADLQRKTREYSYAYLLTVRDDLRPHIVSTRPDWDGDALIMAVGRGSVANAVARPAISLCYPPAEPSGYSLIIDGTASVGDDQVVRFAPTGAVLHRPASEGSPGAVSGCADDCKPVSTDSSG
jgi:hypothetical protein